MHGRPLPLYSTFVYSRLPSVAGFGESQAVLAGVLAPSTLLTFCESLGFSLSVSAPSGLMGGWMGTRGLAKAEAGNLTALKIKMSATNVIQTPKL